MEKLSILYFFHSVNLMYLTNLCKMVFFPCFHLPPPLPNEGRGVRGVDVPFGVMTFDLLFYLQVHLLVVDEVA